MKVKVKYQIELACSTDAARPVLANPHLHADSATPCLAACDRRVRACVVVLLQEARDKNLCDVFECGWNADTHLTMTTTVGELRKLSLLTGARLPEVQDE